jgi:hypothetical protein
MAATAYFVLFVCLVAGGFAAEDPEINMNVVRIVKYDILLRVENI